MNVPIIDIHPHVISTDTARYPRAPLGGHQSDWSRRRPVSVEELIVEQDRAGIAQSGARSGVDLLRARQFLRGRRGGGLSRAVHRRLFVRHPRARRTRDDGALDGAGADRACDSSPPAAPCPARPAGWTIRDRSPPGEGGGERPAGLPADDGGRHSAAGDTCSSGFPAARRPRSSGAAGPGRWPALRGAPTVSGGLRRFPGVYLKVTERNLRRRDAPGKRRRRRSSAGSCPISAPRASPGARIFRPPSGRCPSCSRSRRTRSPS